MTVHVYTDNTSIRCRKWTRATESCCTQSSVTYYRDKLVANRRRQVVSTVSLA